jgi:hypothetical protein
MCTRSRDRTGTALLPLVFETSASTNSAIRALFILVGSAKIGKLWLASKRHAPFLSMQKHLHKTHFVGFFQYQYSGFPYF